MKLAIMQPYFFPYIGYWQLIQAVDRFVIYDDVNYIKGGWVNRNRILINGKPRYLTIPLYQASPNKRICDISMQPSHVWKGKIIKSIENTYRKSPFFSDVFPVVENIITYETESLVEYLTQQLSTLATLLGIKAEFIVTSRSYKNSDLTGQERVIDICKQEGASTYINPQGGQSLYDTATFQGKGINLQFIAMQPMPYKQRITGFVPNLSIIDALMEIGSTEVEQQIQKYDLIAGESTYA